MAIKLRTGQIGLEQYGATVCTLDRRLAEAGPVVGVPTKLPA